MGGEEASVTGPKGAWRIVVFNEFGEVGWGQVMQCFACGDEYFEVDPFFNRQPVEVL